MRIVFIGCVKASYDELSVLLENKKDVVGVITKESSGFHADFKDLKPLAVQYNIPYIYTLNINGHETEEFIRSSQPDIIYCFGWSQMIQKNILDIPVHGVVGFHPAELPHNRGRHPLIWALALGLESTASTFFFMDTGADTGDIISQRKIEIEYSDYAEDLYDKVTKSACEQVVEFTNALENGASIRQKQDIQAGNSWRKRGITDGVIDWRMSSRAIYNLVRALSHPYIGAHFIYKEKLIKVWRVEEVYDKGYRNIEPGKIVKYYSTSDFYVKAYDYVIHVIESDMLEAREGDYL